MTRAFWFSLAMVIQFIPGFCFATSFVEDLRAMERVHRERVVNEMESLPDSGRNEWLERKHSTGLGVGVLRFDRRSTGSIRLLAGLDLRIPVDEQVLDSDDAPAAALNAAFSIIAKYKGLFSIDNPREIFRLDRVRESGHLVHVVLRQEIGGLPVFGSRLVLGFDEGSFVGASGSYVPERLLPREPIATVAPSPESEFGIFHGSLFGLNDWGDMEALFAFRTIEINEYGLPVSRFSSAADGSTLFVRPEYAFDAPADVYYSPTGIEFPGNPVRLDSSAYCGSGTYPNCNWMGTSMGPWFWSDALDWHLEDRYGRDSWDDDNPVDGCQTPHHRLQSTSDSNWTSGGPWGAAWVGGSYCAVAVGTNQAQCYDVIGHEYGHGILRAEFDIQPSSNGQAGAIDEGLADVFGEFFDSWINASQPDWRMGTGTGCNYSRNLANPSASQSLPLFEPEALPDHVSLFKDILLGGSVPHHNATIVGKTAYLLGRPATAPSINHWGVNTGPIGPEDASLVFYGAVTGQELPPDPTFSDLGYALLKSAYDQFYGLVQQIRTATVVTAMGFWTHKSDFGFSSTRPPAAATFTVNGVARNYLFSVEGGWLKYRYRQCAYDFLCNWSTSSVIYPVTSGVSTVVHDGTLWVFWDWNGGVFYKRFYSDGSSSSVSQRSGAATSVAPVAVHVAANLLYLLYRDDAPLTTAATVRLMRYTGSWSAATATAVSTRSPFDAVSLYGDTHVFFRNSDLDLTFKVFDEGSQTWSAAHYVWGHPYFVNDSESPYVVYYKNRIHLIFRAQLPGLSVYRTHLASCSYPCLDDVWTPFTNIDGRDDPDTTWARLFLADGRLYRADYEQEEDQMSWRWKASR